MLPPVARQPDCWRALKIKIQRAPCRMQLKSEPGGPLYHPTPHPPAPRIASLCCLPAPIAPRPHCLRRGVSALVSSTLDPAPGLQPPSFQPTSLGALGSGRRPQCPPYTPFTPFTQSSPSVLSPASPGEAAVLHHFPPLQPAPLSAPDGPANTACRLGSQLWPPRETTELPEGKSGVGF